MTACEELGTEEPRVGELHPEALDSASSHVRLDDVERAIADIAAGRPVVVVDDEDRENEGDIIFAAEKATPELLAFMVRYTSGVICVPMPGADLDRLALPLMTAQNGERMRTAFTVTRGRARRRDARVSPPPTAPPPSPGWPIPRPSQATSSSPATSSRCATRRAACCAAPATPRPPSTWPGWPACAPPGVLAEIVNDDGTMARLPALRAFADAHGLALISIEQLIDAPSPHRGARHAGGPNHHPERGPPTGLPTATAPTWMAPSTWRWSCGDIADGGDVLDPGCTRSA